MLTLPGGSKHFKFASGYSGVVAQYRQQKTLIRQQLQAMFNQGQRSLGIVLQCAPGANDGLTLPSDDYSWFPNLAALIADARAIGFQFVNPELVYMNADDALRNWTAFDNNAANRIWGLIWNLHDQVLAKCGLPFLIDLGGEWPQANGPLACQLATYIWTNYTSAYWPGGVACQDATISCDANLANVAMLPQVFAGNFPDTLDFHPYRDVFNTCVAIRSKLESQGIGGIAWQCGEVMFNDPASAAGLAQFITQTRQTVRRIFQWGCRPDNSEVADLSPYDQWGLKGF